MVRQEGPGEESGAVPGHDRSQAAEELCPAPGATEGCPALQAPSHDTLERPGCVQARPAGRPTSSLAGPP